MRDETRFCQVYRASHLLVTCIGPARNGLMASVIGERARFQRQGVPEYWIVDGEAEAFEIWHPADERAALVDGLLSWLPAGASEPFDLDVAQFVADVADDAT